MSALVTISRNIVKTFSAMITRSKFSSLSTNLHLNHDSKNKLFYFDLDEQKAFVQYKINAKHITLQETEVPAELQGRDIGKTLAKAVFDYVNTNDLKMSLECDFLIHCVNKYFTEYQKNLYNN